MDSFVLVRYGLRCTAFWLALTWLVITGVVLLGDIFEIIRRSSGFTPFSHAIKLACIKIPIHTDYFLPFITFIAARITLWRFDKKNESTALAAVGVSRFFWLRSWGILALVLGGLHLIVLQPISASLYQKWSEYEEKWLHHKTAYRFAIITSGLWLKEHHETGSRIIHAKRLTATNLFDTRVYEWDKDDQFTLYIEAAEAALVEGKWTFKNGYHMSNFQKPEPFEEISRPTELKWSNIASTQIDPRTLSVWRMGDWLPLIKQIGISTRPYLICWHQHIAQVGFIAALLIAALILSKYPLGWMLSGIFIYSAHDIVQALGQAEQLPIMLSTWAVPLIIICLGIGWLIHTEDAL